MSQTNHPERLAGLDPRLADGLVLAWNAELAFDRVVIEGIRTAETVAANWAKGRTKIADGSWMVTDPTAVVTHAQDPESSPHCHAGAVDVMPLVHGLVVWDQTAPEWPECLARLEAMAAIAKRLGLAWGGDFTNLRDYDHFEVPNWRALPLWRSFPPPEPPSIGDTIKSLIGEYFDRE